MRSIDEVKKDIATLSEQMSILKNKLDSLRDEERDIKFAAFCELYSVKAGDIVELPLLGKFQVVDLDNSFWGWVLVRKIKKNGDPFAVTTSISQRYFKDCKVIEHREE